MVSCRELLAVKFEKEVFGFGGDQAGRPVLTVQSYAEQYSNLKKVVTTLERDIKKLLKDYDEKKRVRML